MDPDARDATRIVGTGGGTVASIVGGIVNISDITISGGEQGISITTNAVSELNNLVIEDNVGVEMGGGVHIASNADVVLTDLVIRNNEALQGGGVHLANDAKRLVISGATIEGNSAGETGGGIFASGSLSVGSSWLSDNTAATAGGGLYATLSPHRSMIVDFGEQCGERRWNRARVHHHRFILCKPSQRQ